MPNEAPKIAATPVLSELDLTGLSPQARGEALCAASLARAQETYRLSLLNPPDKQQRPLRYGRVRDNWRNAYD